MLLLLLLGCAHSNERVRTEAAAKKRALPRPINEKDSVTPDLKLAGKVVSVNQNLRFVVLDFPFGDMPALDQRMSVFRQGQKVGELKVSGPQNDTNIVADITAGSAQVGDEARQE